MQQMYKGQVVHTEKYHNSGWEYGLEFFKSNFEMEDGYYKVFHPFIQLNCCEYPERISHLRRNNLLQGIHKSKFINCIYREGAEDIDEGIYVSAKFGKIPVVLNAERTHCYFSCRGKFWKSKVWTDKSGVVYGACAGSQYGEYDGKC